MARVFLTTLNAKFIHSSLALRYLRAFIADAHDVVMEEFTIHDPLDYILGRVYEADPEVVGFSCYIWNIEEIKRLVPLIRKILPHVVIVLGGPEVSYDTKEFLEENKAVDVVVIGEGEAPLRNLLAAIEQHQPYSAVSGIYYRAEDFSIHTTGPSSKLRLDDLPTPYPEDAMDELRNRIVYYEASRGCPFHCQFCLSSIEDGVRYFSLQRVLDDLNRLIKANVRQIKFVDRTFNLRKDYAMKIFEFLVENHGNTTFHFEITGDILKSDIVQWLCEHAPKGLFRFEVGVQSTNDLTNELVRRRQDFTRLAATVRKIKESGRILQHLDLIAGLPEEDFLSFRNTFNDVFELRPDELQLGFLKLLKGTGLRQKAEQFGYVFMDTAPYELLSNHSLTFSDIHRLKHMEDILEKYYNSGRFPYTLEYLITESFPTAFDFFLSFGEFWNAKGWARIGHQPLDLVRRLQAFLEYEGKFDENVTTLLHADFLLREKLRPRSLLWDSGLSQAHQLELLRRLLQAQRTDVSDGYLMTKINDLEKRIVLDHAAIGAIPYMFAQVNVDPSEVYYLAYVYPIAVGRPIVYLLSDSILEVQHDMGLLANQI
ncbi:B12-binding domain-containing radical SAM protein [Sulfoacidibacillus thermotolerans]|uniref:Uncharacterized protein n=1 Tax=Sulfoacidibacillus thermotolerans TaxID=1765684 RepID=A0A2U3DCC6_SULT2|nr:B12-binding domain-containing radical SAM protein [Sulfoacidibacillus thermotolerans]PWI58926.1 hypothetical protein BM613_02285 [Sulfoacidibacillus thermotolerans]